MKQKLVLNWRKTAIIIMLFISVFPAYYHIAGRMVSSVILVPLFFLITIAGKPNPRYGDVKTLRLFFLWVLIKSLIYSYHGETFRALSFSFLIIAIFFAVTNYVVSQERMISLIDMMLFVSVILCLLGILEGITGFNPFILLDTEGNVVRNLERLGIIRIISFTAQATHYALYTSMMALLAIYRISIVKKPKDKVRFYIALGLNIANLLLTLTRSTIVCFIACIFMLVLKMGVGRFLRIVLITLIAASIASVFYEQSFIGQIVYMMLALVNPEFANRLGAGALSEYSNGIADRINLYKWVYESVSGHMLLGMGERTQFAYEHRIDMFLFYYYETKRSIEVYSLYLLYHFGLVGMVSEFLVYIQLSLKALITSFKTKMSFENKISFDYVMFLILILNIVNWFAVAQGEEATTIYILLMIWVCYLRLKKKEQIKWR